MPEARAIETGQPMIFADLLKQHRLAAGLTQEGLAERAHLSRKAVSALECGARLAPRRDTVRLLADALGLADAEREGFMATRRGVVLPADPAPPTDPPCNLPAPPTPLLGREREMARALELLCRDDVRLLTLSGPAGVGKTRLSLDVAAGLRADYADGAFLVSLAPLSDPVLVASAIAQALGLREQGDRPLHDTLMASLRDKQLLLLLDNFEHVAAAAPLLAALLAACPHLRLLVTSRAPVHVRGEHVLPVPPLDLPDLATLPAVDALAQVSAVALFVARAEAVAPDFALTTQNATAVAAICARLDGLPLAIELAAARITLLSPEALLARLDHRLQMLVGGARDLPERQQTLRAAIAWSYDLLHMGEQALFRRLCVFVGGATLEAVEAVCYTAGDLEGDALGWLAALVDKSLLRREEGPGGEARVGLLETIREYGREQLATSGEQAATERSHAAYYLALAEEAEPALTGAEQVTWLARLEREHDNLRSALRWALESGEVEGGLRLAGTLWRFWVMRGYLREGRRWLETLLNRDADVAPASRARALHGAGVLARDMGDCTRADLLLGESLALWRELADSPGIATALNGLGSVAWQRGDLARARALHEEGLALRREMGDTGGVIIALNNLGLVVQDQGDLVRAEALFAEVLAFFRERGNRRGIAGSLNNLGEVALAQGNLTRARLLCEEALALRQGLNDRAGIASSLINLGLIACAQGDLARARLLYEEGLVLYRELGDTRGVGDTMEGRAQVAAAHGHAARAAHLLGAAEAVRAAIGAPLLPRAKAGHDRTVAAARTSLGDDAFAAAWEMGATLSLEQAIVLVLEE